MKTRLLLAAAIGLLVPVSAASAHAPEGGHWEWRSRSQLGPRPTTPALVRVWISDDVANNAACKCSAMKADTSGCTMDMSGKARVPSIG